MTKNKLRINITLDTHTLTLLEQTKTAMNKAFPNRQTTTSEIICRAIKRTYQSPMQLYQEKREYHQAQLLAYAELIQKETAKTKQSNPETPKDQKLPDDKNNPKTE